MGIPAAVALLVGALSWATPAFGQAATTQPVTESTRRPVSPARANKAIQRGLKFLRAARRDDGTWSSPRMSQQGTGVTALVLRASRVAGVEPNEAMFAAGLKALLRGQPGRTWPLAMRVGLLCNLDPNAHRKTIAADAARLAAIQNSASGGWGYGPGHPTTLQDRTYVDSLNTVLAVHALSAAAEAGVSVPDETWQKAVHFWTYSQNDDGGWGLMPPDTKSFRVKPSSYGTTVAAGLWGLTRLTDQWARGNPLPGTDPPTRKPLAAAGDWLARHYTVARIPLYLWGKDRVSYYKYLWMLARAANELGVDRFGKHGPWCDDIRRVLLAQQLPDGSWVRPEPGDLAKAPQGSDAVICTALAMLALDEANRPVLLHRLRFDGGWNGDFRDAASAARWYDGHVAPATWRWATPGTPLPRLRRAPLLLLNTAGNVALDETLSQRIRRYVRCGGTLLVQAREPGSKFNAQLMTFLKSIFPEYRALELPADHPVYSARFRISPDSRPRLVGLAGGRQVRVVVAMSDLSGALHSEPAGKAPAARTLIANLALYATDGKGPASGLIGELPRKEGKVRRRIAIGRGKHNGDWNTCSDAVKRLSAALTNAISIGLTEKTVPLDRPIPASLPLLWITGNDAPKLSAAQMKHIKAYVENGGTVLMDPAAGGETFYRDVTATLKGTTGFEELEPIGDDHPLLSGKLAGGLGSDVGDVRYSRAVRQAKPELRSPVLLGVEHEGRLAVIVSRYGLSCGVEGLPVWNAKTLAPADARRLAMNVLLYAVSQEDQ